MGDRQTRFSVRETTTNKMDIKPIKKMCKEFPCTNDVYAKELCNKHYRRTLPPSKSLELVDVEPVRKWLNFLLDNGFPESYIHRCSGVSHSIVYKILYGIKEKKGMPARRIYRVSRATEEKLLQLDLTSKPLTGIGSDTIGLTRRVQALMTQGHTYKMISNGTGVSVCAIRKMVRGDSTASDTTRNKICEYFNKNKNVIIEVQNRSHALRLKEIKSKGWHSAKAWKGKDIDDPFTEAGSNNDMVDPIAVERAIKGEKVLLTPAERELAVTELLALKASQRKMAKLLNVSERTICRIVLRLKEHN